MLNVLLGVLLTTTVLAQTTPQMTKTNPPKSMTAGATKPNATSMSARSTKPIPAPSQKDNLESKDNAIPSYKQEKDAGVHKGVNRYTPRRTASGARKDTLLFRRPK